jgi:SAM-dependent methyltransferase
VTGQMTYSERLLGSGRGVVAWQRFSRFRRAEREIRALTPARGLGRLLDIGAADGIGLPFWRPLARTVISLNRYAPHSGEFRRAHPLEPVVTGDGTTLPFPDGSIDAVVCLETLHFINRRADRLRCLDEIRRVLRPGGIFVCSVAMEVGLPALIKYVGRRLTHNELEGVTGGVALKLCFHRVLSLEEYAETGQLGFSAYRFAEAAAERFTILRRPSIPLPWPLCTNLMFVCRRD